LQKISVAIKIIQKPIMILLDGKKIAGKLLNEIKKEIKEKKLQLKLAVILVGENSVSEIFIREKEKACQKVGIDFELFKFPSIIAPETLEREIKKIVDNPENSGIVIQLPLPKDLNVQEILNLIPSEKDIDVLSEKSIRKFKRGELKILPPVVEGIKIILEEYKISLKDKKTVIVGAGRLVGKPLSFWLKREGVEFSIIDEKTKNISARIKEADIVISGVGKKGLIKGGMIKNGAIVIDAGSSCEKDKISGDVDFKSVSQKASYITPVPGGIGPLTVACLLKNLVKMNKK